MMQVASIVIPVKGIAAGKSRLATVVSPEQRAALNRRLAEHVLQVALDVAQASETDIAIYLLSPDQAIAEIARSHAAHFLHQKTTGLNEGLAEAVVDLPPHRTVFLAADLPTLTSDDIAPLLNAKGIALAPDHGQTGTNALSVPEPESLPFSFGTKSMQLHLDAARNLGLPVQLIQRPGLAFDLDTKEDLERTEGWP
ncbi:MAG: 2-phospho-L-lactate guanylyltransferase [Alphaproteobacteria bacterium]|jgi:2-phospho-L-lactate guanylyltransferase